MWPYVPFACNSSPHDTAGYSPLCLLCGRDPTLPLDTLLPTSGDQPLRRSEYTGEAIARADNPPQIARPRLYSWKAGQKTIYDRKHRVSYFTPGCLVLRWTPTRKVGLCEKLLPRYCDPYRVLRQVSDVTCEISHVSPPSSTHVPPTDIVHVARLKPSLTESPYRRHGARSAVAAIW